MQLIQRGIISVRVQRLRNRGQNASRQMLKRTQLLYACVFCLLCKYFLQGRRGPEMTQIFFLEETAPVIFPSVRRYV